MWTLAFVSWDKVPQVQLHTTFFNVTSCLHLHSVVVGSLWEEREEYGLWRNMPGFRSWLHHPWREVLSVRASVKWVCLTQLSGSWDRQISKAIVWQVGGALLMQVSFLAHSVNPSTVPTTWKAWDQGRKVGGGRWDKWRTEPSWGFRTGGRACRLHTQPRSGLEGRPPALAG